MGLIQKVSQAVEAAHMLDDSRNRMCDKVADEIPATITTALNELTAQLDGIDRALETLVQVLAPLCMQGEERMKTLTPPPPCSKHASEIYELAQRAESVKEELVGLLNTINLS